MTVVICEHTNHCWCSPPPLWPTDAEHWGRFCLEINSRIARVRLRSGRDDIGTFEPPIPAYVNHRALLVGGVKPASPNARDERGRFRRSA